MKTKVLAVRVCEKEVEIDAEVEHPGLVEGSVWHYPTTIHVPKAVIAEILRTVPYTVERKREEPKPTENDWTKEAEEVAHRCRENRNEDPTGFVSKTLEAAFQRGKEVESNVALYFEKRFQLDRETLRASGHEKRGDHFEKKYQDAKAQAGQLRKDLDAARDRLRCIGTSCSGHGVAAYCEACYENKGKPPEGGDKTIEVYGPGGKVVLKPGESVIAGPEEMKKTPSGKEENGEQSHAV